MGDESILERFDVMIWNPWHGCKKYSEGCQNCYVYRRDDKIGKDASLVYKTKSFYMPLRKNKKGEYKIPPGTLVYLSMTSDFFLDEADEWRNEIWEIVRIRSDLKFMIITKRIERFLKCIPNDWDDGYENVAICCTIENQRTCDIRLPIFLKMPIKHKYITCEPLLEAIDFKNRLDKSIIQIVAGGESGNEARICNYDWILSIREQCIKSGVKFHFKQTGAKFIKQGRMYRILRKYQHYQARKAGIDINSES